MSDVKKVIADALLSKTETPMQELQKHLNAHKSIERVYFNDEGQWIFHKREGFPIEHSRDEILETGFELSKKEIDAADQNEPKGTETTIDANQQKNASLPVYDITKNYSVKQMAAYIDAAQSVEEVNLYVKESNKPETVELIKTKLASFDNKENQS